MSLFKCKMCGGSLEIAAGTTVIECEYCGTKQTLPKLDDDRRANMYDRANHFRRNNEFDKAMGIYENILNEDNTDAEAYWSLVLCRYGIEYVEDPATHKRIPTVNRAQFTSIFDDDNYKSALQYADSYQRAIYEEEAKAINEIQKGILAISQKEEPFDVFICYKESDNNGRRTPDSVLAQDLYYQLKQEGFKVFFSRITLEDKLGSAYEPYIFSALNSAKVMVALGTKPEYFNAVWVKNEWSRYLALIKQGQKKMLIPAYKDMDPYDLPEEFSHLQAQDMSKLGFMQDLIRGIKKIVKSDEPKTTTVVKETVVPSTNANIAPLLKRAFMFLEDGDFDSANEYCEKVLDQDPENAQAYLGKLMAEFKTRKQESLKERDKPFDNNSNYQKAVRFADEKLKATLTGYIEHINTRNENKRIDGIYNDAIALMNKSTGILISTGILNKLSNCEEAIKKFQSISGWKDADEQIVECQKKIEELKAQAEAERIEKERLAEIARKEAEIKAKRNKKIAAVVVSLMLAVVVFFILLHTVIMPNIEYNDAVSLMNAEKYTEAISAFEALDGYKDSATKISECHTAILDVKYDEALALMDSKKFTEAISAFEALNGHRDSISKIAECKVGILDVKYDKALQMMKENKYTSAISAFEALDGHRDSVQKIIECNNAILDEKYDNALRLMKDKQYISAIYAFEALNGHRDSAQKIIECNNAILDEKYDIAIGFLNEGNIVKAYEALVALGDHKDSAQKAESLRVEYEVEKIKSATVGSYVTFGSYEQDGKTSNGKESIQWKVLEKKGSKVLVISNYALDAMPYNTIDKGVTWETCTLRKWLNNDFINAAFSADEKAMIPAVTVSADKNPDYSTNPGNATKDQVFLLSITEVNKYFNSDSARQCKPTDCAVASGAYVNSSKGNCWWWLRSPGRRQNDPADVNNGGDVSESGLYVDCVSCAVRPALWIDIS